MSGTRGGGAVLGQSKAARAVAIMVVAGAFVAAGCQTDREVTEPEPVEVTTELLTEQLLTEADVPSPYVLDEDADPIPAEIVPEHDCDDRLKDLEPESTAQVVFDASGTDTLSNTISYYPGQGAAVSEIYSDLLEDCAQVVVEDKGVRFTTKPLDFGVLSDDTFPLVVELVYDDGKINQRNLIVMRDGDLISTIRLDGPRPTDKVVLDTVTRVALGNLGELAQETT